MELKNIFKMTKTDRYTQDGRDELAKLQETEDVRPTNGIYHWKSGDYRKEGDKYVKIGPGTGGAGRTPQKQNPTRSYSFEVGSNGMPKPGTGKQVQTFKTKKEAQEALNKQNAAAGEKKPDNTREKLRKFREATSKKQELPDDLQKQAQEFVASATPERVERYIKALRTPFSRERDNFENPDRLAEALETELKKNTEGKKAAENKITIRQGPNTKTLNETMAEHLTKNLDAYKGYDDYSMNELVLEPSGYELQGTTKSKSGKSSSIYIKGQDKVELFYDKNGELENVRTSAKNESEPAESKSAKTSWKDAKVSLTNPAKVPLSLNFTTFNMTPAWAKKHGYSPDDVNGTAAQVKLAKEIITSQDWSNPEEAVRKINDLDFGYNNWRVTEKQEDRVKITQRDSMGNLHEMTIKRPQAASDAAPRQLTGDYKIRVRKA